jgi:hypothetical protein
MIGECEVRFPELLILWQNHDLVNRESEGWDPRPEFYKGLRREDELKVWRFIEEQYLLRYMNLVRVEFEWSAEGLWGIPFPGSLRLGEYLSPRDFKLPENLTVRIREWHGALDRLDPAGPELEDEASHEEGLAVAKEVKLFLGDDYYVEYRPFREIIIRDGEPVELEIPKFITDLSGRDTPRRRRNR